MPGKESGLSAEAQELIRLTTSSGDWGGRLDTSVDVGTLLQSRPELLKGMKEYLKWRDDENQSIAETKKSAPLGHELKGLAARIRRKVKKGK